MSETRAVVRSGGVVLASAGDLVMFGQLVHKSGLAPKGMSAEGCAVAVQYGLEIGLTPMQALQSIGVINGRPGLFGDAAKALVQSSGLLQDFDEYFEAGGKRVDVMPAPPGDDFAAVCVSVRVGAKRPLVTRFSVADAKRAALWGKLGPWSQYPQRMLMFRARGFNLRDNFADVLKGIKTIEELRDYPDASGVEPTSRVEVRTEAQAPEAQAPEAPAALPDDATPAQHIWAIVNTKGWSAEEFAARLEQKYGVNTPEELTTEQSDELLSILGSRV